MSTEPARHGFVLNNLPGDPVRVVEIGCGGGELAHAMYRAGHAVTAIDPQAPDTSEGPRFHRRTFEEAELADASFDVSVACLSLHHVADLGPVLDKTLRLLRPGGTMIVAEYGWDRIDERTGRWCAARLPAPPYPDGAFLATCIERWRADGTRPLRDHCADWAAEEGMHDSVTLLRELRRRFDEHFMEWVPYLHDGLAVTEAEEAEAIRAGHIQATGFHFAGHRPGTR